MTEASLVASTAPTPHAFAALAAAVTATKAAALTSMLASLGAKRSKLGSLLGGQDVENGDPGPDRALSDDLAGCVSAGVEGFDRRLVELTRAVSATQSLTHLGQLGPGIAGRLFCLGVEGVDLGLLVLGQLELLESPSAHASHAVHAMTAAATAPTKAATSRSHPVHAGSATLPVDTVPASAMPASSFCRTIPAML